MLEQCPISVQPIIWSERQQNTLFVYSFQKLQLFTVGIAFGRRL